VIAVPKTVDNDLPGTDVAPGYGSAARYTAQSLRDAWLDLHAMRSFDDVVVYEVMGRHAGWLAAASALARSESDGAPHLILLPEARLEEGRLLDRVAEIHVRQGVCLIAAAEGVRDSDGAFLAEKGGSGGSDAGGQRVLSMAAGVAFYLCGLIQQRLGLRTRQVRPNTLQRAGLSLVSDLDRDLAWMVGAAAVQAAMEGATDLLMGLARTGNEWHVAPLPLAQQVGRERHFPTEWLAGEYDVAPAFVEYATPFVEPLSPAPILW
jgi:6-phosphofructokinase 1